MSLPVSRQLAPPHSPPVVTRPHRHLSPWARALSFRGAHPSPGQRPNPATRDRPRPAVLPTAPVRPPASTAHRPTCGQPSRTRELLAAQGAATGPGHPGEGPRTEEALACPRSHRTLSGDLQARPPCARPLGWPCGRSGQLGGPSRWQRAWCSEAPPAAPTGLPPCPAPSLTCTAPSPRPPAPGLTGRPRPPAGARWRRGACTGRGAETPRGSGPALRTRAPCPRPDPTPPPAPWEAPASPPEVSPHPMLGLRHPCEHLGQPTGGTVPMPSCLPPSTPTLAALGVDRCQRPSPGPAGLSRPREGGWV